MFENIIDIDYTNGKLQIEGLSQGCEPVFVFDLFKKTNRGIILLTNTLYEANKLYDAISNYTTDALLFPMDDFNGR